MTGFDRAQATYDAATPPYLDDEDVCGYTFDHDIDIPDPAWPEQWICLRCGAEGWDESEDGQP